ncbi:DUF4446 family protein [Paenibacillus athensensis]|uniref:Uncharacterized protein n=1 Tax=Paenibacillus athensensis TaxID=1967502 RepID=A0A4Y8PW17_9BACL|nr:DUF4446 family protein [Paenibacillus athensensis]MCD1261807.1 DUF4446 family protein [Paenibacillus athensensis]
MGELFQTTEGVLLAGNMVVSLILLILFIVWAVKLSKLRRKYTQMMNGGQVDDLEGLLTEIQMKLNTQKAESDQTAAKVEQIITNVKSMKSNVAIHRYNAFGEPGSDLSFTVAMLDDQDNGLIMTGIHSREQTYIYAKPVQKGQSTYTLSPEEKEAITLTAKQKLRL